MHKPYALAPCGHTTCYECLVRWFTAPKNPEAANAAPAENDGVDAIINSPIAMNGAYIRRRKTCPVCRAAVSDRPIEMWGIKGMVAAFVKSGLGDLPVPAPAAVEVEAGANVDPWRNVFRKAAAPNRHIGFFPPFFAPAPPPTGDEDREQMGWYDGEDGGVYRCLDCYHEIIYGHCSQCQRRYAGHPGGDDDEDDDEDHSDLDDPRFRHPRMRGLQVDMDDESIDDDEMYMYAEAGMDWDIETDDADDDGAFYGGAGDDGAHDLGAPHSHAHLAELLFGHPNLQAPRRHGVARIEEVDVDEEEEDEESGYEDSFIDDGNDGSDDEVEIVEGPHPVPRALPPARRRPHVQTILSDDEPEIDDPRMLAWRLGRASRLGGPGRHPAFIDLEHEDADENGDANEDEDEQMSDDPLGGDGGSLSPRGRAEYAFMQSDGEEDDLSVGEQWSE